MPHKPSIEVALKLTGEAFSAEEVTAAIQLIPTDTWHKGDIIQKTALRHKQYGWKFQLPSQETHDMEAVLHKLLDMVEPSRERIIKAADKFGLHKEISFAVYIRDETPSVLFAADTLSSIAAMGCDIDIDLILVA